MTKQTNKVLSILDNDYLKWIGELSKKYRQSQIKAAIHVNSELISYYFYLGKEIHESSFKKKYGNQFFESLSNGMRNKLPDAKGFSPRNLRYVEKFYTLYKPKLSIMQQLVAQLSMVPWGHHVIIIDKCKNVDQALFFVQKTIENNWSRAVLLNFLDTDLYERNGKSINNFKTALPDTDKDLAKEITKDPYSFNFLTLEKKYSEKELKDALIGNIQKFLLELGTGFAYMGREYRLPVGQTEQFLDMLFYNTNVHAYVVVEVKVTDFKPDYIGQLGTYVVAVDHILKTERDEKTIGILICKGKDEILARYSVDSSSQPLGISSFELSKLIPDNYKSSLPTIDELENELSKNK